MTKHIVLVLMLVAIFSLPLPIFSTPNGRIVGGQEAFAGQFPWIAAIYLTSDQGNFFCGGSLFTDQFVLTAGQCVDQARIFTILLGTHQLQGNDLTVRVATETYFLHPEYNALTLEHDVGIIKLREPVTYSDYLSATGLTFFVFTGGATAMALGWGQDTDEGEGLVNNLRWVYLTTLSIEECQIYYGSQVTDSMICAIGSYNEGTCIGDSGTPLVVMYRNVYMIIAVSSFVSANGCESTNPSGYTNIFIYKEWIQNVTATA